MPVRINETVVVTGHITNSTTGQVALSEKIGGTDKFRSMQLSKYPDGTRLEITFRVTNKNQRQMVRAIEIAEGDLFRVHVLDIDTKDGETPRDFLDSVHRAINMDIELYNESLVIADSGIAQFDIMRGADYDDAIHLAREIDAAFGKSVTVMVTKHTPEDMPEQAAPKGIGAINALEWVDGFYIAKEIRPIFVVAAAMKKTGKAMNVLLKGPSGCGKTSVLEALASWLGYEYHRVNCSTILDAESWFGIPAARDGSTLFELSSFSKLLQRGNVLINLDEVNRLEPWLLGSLFPLLDHARETEVHGVKIKVGPNVIFGMTMNVGVQYAGTHATDAAFVNRALMSEEVSYPERNIEELICQKRFPEVKESDIKSICNVVHKLRAVVVREQIDIDVSPRTTLNTLEIFSKGVKMRQAIRYTIINNVPDVERKSILDTINSLLGSNEFD